LFEKCFSIITHNESDKQKKTKNLVPRLWKRRYKAAKRYWNEPTRDLNIWLCCR